MSGAEVQSMEASAPLAGWAFLPPSLSSLHPVTEIHFDVGERDARNERQQVGFSPQPFIYEQFMRRSKHEEISVWNGLVHVRVGDYADGDHTEQRSVAQHDFTICDKKTGSLG